MSAYERFSLFSLAFAVVVVVCLFVSFLKQERHFEYLSYGGSWHRATQTGLCKFVQNNSRDISGLGKRADLKIREV